MNDPWSTVLLFWDILFSWGFLFGFVSIFFSFLAKNMSEFLLFNLEISSSNSEPQGQSDIHSTMK